MTATIARVARLGLLLGLTAVLVLNWLPLVRSLLDGPSYQWGLQMFGRSFGGAGLEGDYGLLVGWAAIGVGLIFLGWRRPGPLFKVAALLWTGALAADSAWIVWSGQEVAFEGATLGVALSFERIAAGIYGLLFLLAATWALLGRPERASRWTGLNTALLATAVLMLPVQYLLLRTGQGQEARDVIGVLMTMGQWLLISLSLVPWPDRGSRRLA